MKLILVSIKTDAPTRSTLCRVVNSIQLLTNIELESMNESIVRANDKVCILRRLDASHTRCV